MLRIHIEDAPGTYSIPTNNPFFGSPTEAQEVWLWGLRNPWRNSFDRRTGDMYLGDVGQGEREEVDVQKASNPGGGENYGWRVREGFIQNPRFANDPPPPGAVDPIFDYPHSTGQTVIGGLSIAAGRCAICGDSTFSQIISAGKMVISPAKSGRCVMTGRPRLISRISQPICFRHGEGTIRYLIPPLSVKTPRANST